MKYPNSAMQDFNVGEVKRDHILKVLVKANCRIEDRDDTAAILELHPSTLRARMHQPGIVRPETKEPD